MTFGISESSEWLLENDTVIGMLEKQWVFIREIARAAGKPRDVVERALDELVREGILVATDDLTLDTGCHYRLRVRAEREEMVAQEDILYQETRRNLHITQVAANAVIEREFAKLDRSMMHDENKLLKDSTKSSEIAESISSGVVDGDAIINAGQALALAVLAQEHLLSDESRGISYDDQNYEKRSVDRWLARRGNR